MFSLCLHGFPLGTQASTHNPKTYLELIGLIGYSKLAIGVNLSVSGWLLFVSQPCDELVICPGCTPCLCPMPARKAPRKMN